MNVCRLSDWYVDGNGISQLPLVMEAVFPIGPIVPITCDGRLAGAAEHTPRSALKKVNGSDVQTANFLNPLFANVSAVVQGHQKDMFKKDLVLSTIHNPLASNPLPIGLFGVYKEFVAEERGSEYQIKNVAMKG